MKLLRCSVHAVLTLAVVLSIILAGLIVFLSITDYRPAAWERLNVGDNPGLAIPQGVELTFLSWNIGYCGLGSEADFFYDGGSMVRAKFEQFEVYLNGVNNILSQTDTIDFILLQEVDLNARRSYHVNQPAIFSTTFSDFGYVFAKNYDARFIPFPFLKPLGRVTAGQMILSRFTFFSSGRISSPVNYAWPKRLFFPDRCFLLSRHKIPGRKDLVVINVHHSAWNEGAGLRRQELETLKGTALQEYGKGNYVVIGGDWNQSPAGYRPHPFKTGDRLSRGNIPVPTGFFPSGWYWAYDAGVPTNRDVDAAYRKGKTPTTILDYFLLSPNIEIREVKNMDKGFSFSDHNPVYLRIGLKIDSLSARQ